MESSRLLKGADFKGGLPGSKFPWRDLEGMIEMVTEKQSQKPGSRENSGCSNRL